MSVEDILDTLNVDKDRISDPVVVYLPDRTVVYGQSSPWATKALQVMKSAEAMCESEGEPVRLIRIRTDKNEVYIVSDGTYLLVAKDKQS